MKKALVKAILKTLKQREFIPYEGELVASYATFEYNGTLYEISLKDQHLRYYVPRANEWVYCATDTRGRESYMFYKTPTHSDGTGNCVETVCKCLLNLLLLKPGAMVDYFTSDVELTANHKSSYVQSYYDYKIAMANYRRFDSIRRNGVHSDSDREFFYNCRNSNEKEYRVLREASNNLRCLPKRLRYDDISNLELISRGNNSRHAFFIKKLTKYISNICEYMIPYSFVAKWNDSAVTDNEVNSDMIDELVTLNRVTDKF